MDLSPRTTFLLISLTILLQQQTLPTPAFSKTQSIIFHFPPFSHKNLTLVGSSILQNGSLCLTGTSGGSVPSPSQLGAAWFCLPAGSFNHPVSFSSSISFSAASPNPLMFFLSPNSSILALLHSPQEIKNASPVAMEISVPDSLKTQIDIARIDPGLIAITIKNHPFLHERYYNYSIPIPFVEHNMCVGIASEALVIESWSLSTSSRMQVPARRSLISPSRRDAPGNFLHTLIQVVFPAAAAVAAIAFACAAPSFTKKEELKVLKKFRKLKFDAIEDATNNFDDESKVEILGGGAADVYRMRLPGEISEYAVKRFKQDPRGRQAFFKEAEAMSRIGRHVNIHRLQGWCFRKPDERLLIYHLMGTTLHSALQSQESLFSWTRRNYVALKIATALRHLHHECAPPVVHCGISSSNILLDDGDEPRLAGFDLAIISGPLSTTGLVWADTSSSPYNAPEYWPGAKVDARSDVYSYGMLVLEICTGRDPRAGERNALLNEMREMLKSDRLLNAADQRLVDMGNIYDPGELSTLLRVGLACTGQIADKRPTMAQVVEVIEKQEGAEELLQMAE